MQVIGMTLEPTSTVFSRYNFTTNKSGGIVAYCFADVEGYSKFGTFTGNGSTDGTYIYTGFRPQFILAKSSGSGSWHLVDSEELDVNPVGYFKCR